MMNENDKAKLKTFKKTLEVTAPATNLRTNKFARKPFYIDAVRVSEANIEEVAAWCGGKIETEAAGKFIKVTVHRPLNDRQTQAFIGDWVLYAGSGFKVYTPSAFDKSFERVKTLTKAQADEAGIKVPHEPRAKMPKPAAPKKKAAATEIGEGIEVVAEVPKKSKADIEADKLINEVLREK